ncbi:hypothetical protein EDC04DRAFT_2602342 [Pisolithus marmoratus]|nr:hypothetical protein EDC04DRAFT_2602342 [Pisolithus marmoratus]
MLPKHVFNSYQAEVCLNLEHEDVKAEYVGPSSRLYCNYHPGLNAQRCDACGQFLPANAPLPPYAERASDDWTPYHNWLEFKLADFLFMHAGMTARKIDMLLDIWATSLIGLGELLFTNHTDLYCIIDSTCIGNVKWDNFNHHSVHSILTSLELTDKLDYVLYQEYNASNDQRHWQDFMLGDWAWAQVHYNQVAILPGPIAIYGNNCGNLDPDMTSNVVMLL